MVDADKRKKWNYSDSSSAQYAKYLDKMNTMHPTQTEQYPGQNLFQFSRAPRSRKEAQQMMAQQQLLEYAQQQRNLQQLGRQPVYGMPSIPQTPMGFVGVQQFDPYGRFRR